MRLTLLFIVHTKVKYHIRKVDENSYYFIAFEFFGRTQKEKKNITKIDHIMKNKAQN